MAAAVADYEPVAKSGKKIKKSDEDLTLGLKRTKDILGSLGKVKSKDQILVGFALETDNEQDHALKKLKEKNADIIVLNSLRNQGAGFGHDTNRVTLFFKNGHHREIELKPKTEIAKDIVDSITELE
jgi:phosphopantothenoylcysteine decarboxylase/phosphopantothenate--cysteine ligase